MKRLLLVIFVFAVILAAGCTSTEDNDKQLLTAQKGIMPGYNESVIGCKEAADAYGAEFGPRLTNATIDRSAKCVQLEIDNAQYVVSLENNLTLSSKMEPAQKEFIAGNLALIESNRAILKKMDYERVRDWKNAESERLYAINMSQESNLRYAKARQLYAEVYPTPTPTLSPDQEWQVRISCPYSWSATIDYGNSKSVDGMGTKTINLGRGVSTPIVVVAQKNVNVGGQGTLKVEILHWGQVVSTESTDAGYGEVTVTT